MSSDKGSKCNIVGENKLFWLWKGSKDRGRNSRKINGAFKWVHWWQSANSSNSKNSGESSVMTHHWLIIMTQKLWIIEINSASFAETGKTAKCNLSENDISRDANNKDFSSQRNWYNSRSRTRLSILERILELAGSLAPPNPSYYKRLIKNPKKFSENNLRDGDFRFSSK